MTEAQPTDPVRDAVLLVDGFPDEVRSTDADTRSSLVPSRTKSRDGRRHSVNVTVRRERWTIEDLTEAITHEVLDAAERAGLDVDAQEARNVARTMARRELSPWRWFRS